jgi:protein-disulfide isomerase
MVSNAQLVRGAFAAAFTAAAALIAVSLIGAQDTHSTPPPANTPSVVGARETEAIFRGIPQDGIVLGSPNAPVTVVEYADLQCPYCALWAHDALPQIVERYVRPGHVRIVFHGLAFIGPESESALRAALAAGRQAKLWNLVHLLYANQGHENAGWVTDDFLRQLGDAIRGFEPQAMLAGRSLPAAERAMAAAAAAAQRARIPGTPAFEVGPSGGTLERVDVGDLELRIEQLLDA